MENTCVGYVENCPECGHPLRLMHAEVLETRPSTGNEFRYERRSLIRHCENCLSDWENEWWTEFGDVGESELRRKLWG